MSDQDQNLGQVIPMDDGIVFQEDLGVFDVNEWIAKRVQEFMLNINSTSPETAQKVTQFLTRSYRVGYRRGIYRCTQAQVEKRS